MSYIDSLFFTLHTVSMLGTAYIFYNKCGPFVKKIINHSSVTPFKNKVIDFNDKDLINEDRFCSIVAGFSGLFIGRYVWQVCLPYTFWRVQRDYGPTIKKFLSDG